jgi:hypothetical protein
MNPEDTQMLGIVLTIVGVALSIIGYVIYLNIRGDKSDIDESDPPDESASEAAPDWAGDLSNEVLVRAFPEENTDPEPGEMPGLKTSTDSMESRSAPAFGSTGDSEYLTVATILRQAESGELKIQVNDKEYESVDQLRMTDDWPKISRMSKDISRWMDAKPAAPARMSTGRVETSSESASSDNDDMISQINSIIEEKAKGFDSTQSSIRLVEGLGGVLRVYVGVENFPLDEVPYDHVRELIRESVAEWEASQ